MAKYINNVLSGIIAFFLTYCWVHYCTKIVTLSKICGIVCGILFTVIMFVINKPTRNTATSKNKLADSLAEYLQYNTNNAELFSQALRLVGYVTESIDYDSFVATKNATRRYVTVSYGKVTDDVIRNAVVNAKRNKCSNVVLFAESVNGKTAEKLSKLMPCSVIFDKTSTYDLLNEADLVPVLPKATRRKIFVPSEAFTKKRSVWYYVSALFLCLFSLITFYPVYTLIWASICLLLGLFSTFNKKFNNVSDNINQL